LLYKFWILVYKASLEYKLRYLLNVLAIVKYSFKINTIRLGGELLKQSKDKY